MVNKLRLYFSLILFGCLVVTACEKNDKGKTDYLTDYILSAEITNIDAEVVKIDNFAKFIELNIPTTADKTNVMIKLTLANGMSMKSPADLHASYDLSKKAVILLTNASGQEIKFSINIKEFIPTIDPVSKGWVVSTGFGSLSDGITVYKSPAKLQGKNAVAFIALAKPDYNITFDVVLGGEIVEGRKLSGAKTPAEFYASDKYPVILNGGYFTYQSGYYQLSLVCKNNSVLIGAQQDVWPGDGNYYLPARGIFSYIEGTGYKAEWAVTSGSTTYTYSNPVAKPTTAATFPSFDGARNYTAKTGIGGGPVLISKGVVVNTYSNEMFKETTDVGATINNPRTAIGATADGNLILFVCEGRNKTPDTPGFTLEETANILLELGCVEAVNLDGGGSSCMLVNGNETIKPSDGSQRAVTSAIILK